MKNIKFILTALFALFSFVCEAKVQLYAYHEKCKDNFDEECILCTPSEEYAATIAFTKHWKITYWRNQAYLGRSLVISQRHFGTYEEMSDEEATEYREILRQYLPALKKAFNATHFNVCYLMNQAYREGKPDPHFHWHILPRYDSKRCFDGEEFADPDFGSTYEMSRKQYLTGEFQENAIRAIRENLDITYINMPSH